MYKKNQGPSRKHQVESAKRNKNSYGYSPEKQRERKKVLFCDGHSVA